MTLQGLNVRPVCVVLMLCVSISAIAQNENAPVVETPAVNPPEHPITEAQIRMFFDECHIPTVSRQLTHEKAEMQRKQLPPWYPQPVWDEIEAASDSIDLALVALPVYRKYMSEEQADRLIKFFRTKPGQDVIEAFLEQEIRAQHTGTSPSESHKQ